jgi:hypothetical protein
MGFMSAGLVACSLRPYRFGTNPFSNRKGNARAFFRAKEARTSKHASGRPVFGCSVRLKVYGAMAALDLRLYCARLPLSSYKSTIASGAPGSIFPSFHCFSNCSVNDTCTTSDCIDIFWTVFGPPRSGGTLDEKHCQGAGVPKWAKFVNLLTLEK